mgnify:CR=1 FL=1|jgi:hypothetical protein
MRRGFFGGHAATDAIWLFLVGDKKKPAAFAAGQPANAV